MEFTPTLLKKLEANAKKASNMTPAQAKSFLVKAGIVSKDQLVKSTTEQQRRLHPQKKAS